MDTASNSDWLVACLCAAWCGSCRDYRATFEALAASRTDCRFVWVDIEDEADALAPFDLDIDDFPTLLIAHGTELRFFGALTPESTTLARTLAAAHAAVLVAQPPVDSQALVACIAAIGVAVADKL